MVGLHEIGGIESDVQVAAGFGEQERGDAEGARGGGAVNLGGFLDDGGGDGLLLSCASAVNTFFGSREAKVIL